MSNHFLFSVYLETCAPVEADAMRQAVVAGLTRKHAFYSLLNFVDKATVHSIPLHPDVEGITAHALVEIVRLMEHVCNLQTVLHDALDLLKAPGDILQAQANGDVEKVAYWIANESRK